MKAIKRTRIADLLKSREYGVEVNVRGWVRTRRSSKQVAFVALNDGSTINNVQVVIDADKFDEELVKQFTTGACLGKRRPEGSLPERPLITPRSS